MSIHHLLDLDSFRFLVIANKAAGHSVQVWVGMFGYGPRSGIAGSHGSGLISGGPGRLLSRAMTPFDLPPSSVGRLQFRTSLPALVIVCLLITAVLEVVKVASHGGFDLLPSPVTND